MYLVVRRAPGFLRTLRFVDWRLAVALVFFSLLPDADAAPGLLTGDIGLFHNTISHSLLTGVAAAVFAAVAARLARLGSAWRWAIFALLCCEIHILMDFVCHGRGVMAFWPLTSLRFRSPIVLFYGLHWSDGLISMNHVWTILTESVFGISLIWLVSRLPAGSSERG